MLLRHTKLTCKGETQATPLFARFARWVERQVGRSSTFVLAIAVVLLWAVSGPLFGWSDTWQLVINTGTTIVRKTVRGDIVCTSRVFARLPFRKLGPAITGQALGVFRGHIDSAVFPDVQMPTRVSLHGAYAARRAKANPRAFPLLELLRPLGVVFHDGPVLHLGL